MKYTQRLFVYQRREIILLTLIGLAVIAFAFTLGIHWGKSLSHMSASTEALAPDLVQARAERAPNPEELSDPGKDASEVLDHTLNEAIRKEVTRTGIRIDHPKTMKLPLKPKHPNAGATHIEH